MKSTNWKALGCLWFAVLPAASYNHPARLEAPCNAVPPDLAAGQSFKRGLYKFAYLLKMPHFEF